MDEERQPGSAGESRNGMDPAGTGTWRSRHWAFGDDKSDRWKPPTGLDEDTPQRGLPTMEPPLWREAAHHSPGYGAQLAQYADYLAPHSVVRTEPAPALLPDEASAPDEWEGRGSPDHHEPEALPKRVPAEPELPDGLGEPPVSGGSLGSGGAGPEWTAPELARIADELRRYDVPREAPPAEGFDADEVLAAVRAVPGVRAASLRPNSSGVHTLRLDLADDADPVQVSRMVARMLSERMGLAATASELPPATSHRTPELSPARGSAPPARGSVPLTRSATEEPVEVVSRPLPPPHHPGARVVIDHVQVNMFGLDATVEVRLAAGERRALGLASGPAVDGYVTRLAAVSAAKAIDQLLHDVDPEGETGRCFVEHTGVVPFGATEVAVVVVQLVCEGWVEQLAGCAVVAGDPRQAVVRATLGAVNRRLEALLR